MWTISTWWGTFQISGNSFYYMMTWSQTVSLHSDYQELIAGIAAVLCTSEPLICAILGGMVYVVLGHMVPTRQKFSMVDWKFTWGWGYIWGIPCYVWFHYDGSHIFY